MKDDLAAAIYDAIIDNGKPSTVIARFATLAAQVARHHLAEQVGALRGGDAPYEDFPDVDAWRHGVADAEELIRGELL